VLVKVEQDKLDQWSKNEEMNIVREINRKKKLTGFATSCIETAV
jgi:hypothetical protein